MSATNPTPELTENTELTTPDGEPVEITNEQDTRVCLHFPERDAVEGYARTEWRAKTALAGAIQAGVFSVAEDSEDADSADAGRMDGEFTETVQCPDCGAFMHTGYDGAGFPIARCSRVACEAAKDVDELMAAGEWVEA